jgi:hypothetical protein
MWSLIFCGSVFLFGMFSVVQAADLQDISASLSAFWPNTSIYAVVSTGDEVYVGENNKFARYDISTGTATDLSSLWSYGATSLAYDPSHDAIYIGGAFNGFARYNISTGTVTDLTSHINALWGVTHVGAITIDVSNGAVYVVGTGVDSIPQFARYDIATNTATDLSSLISSFWTYGDNTEQSIALDPVNGIVYIGGQGMSGEANFIRYNIASNTATDLTDDISFFGASKITSIVVNPATDVAYLGLGWDFGSYDPHSDTVTNLSSYVIAADMKNFALDSANQVLYLGQYAGDSSGYNTFAQYDIATNTYTDLSYMIEPFWSANYGSIIESIFYDTTNETVYMGGHDSWNYKFFGYTGDSITAPTVTTDTPTDITSTTTTLNGTISATGGEDPERLIQWGTVSGIYIDHCTAGTGGTGTYSCNLTNLTPGTTYYVQAYATNSAGTSYGSETSFQTLQINESGSNQISATIGENLTLDCGTDIDIDNGSSLIPETPESNSTTCTITTNDNNGYDLQLTNDRGSDNTLYHTTQSATIDGQIQDKTAWNPTTPNAQTFTGTGLAFGILQSNATKNESWWGNASTCDDTDQLYAGIPHTSTDIMRHTSYSNANTQTTICYRVNVPSTQIAGEYEGSVTYTASGRP